MEKTNESFLQYINHSNKPIDFIEVLKKETLPLVMWGCGDLGNTLWEYLLLNGIRIDDIFVDGDAKHIKFNDYTVLTLNEVLEKYPAFNLILGHSCYRMGNELAKTTNNIKNIFLMPSVFYHQDKNIPYSFVEENESSYNKTYFNLADDASKECMIAYLNARINGQAELIYPYAKKELSFFQNDLFDLSEDEVYLDIGAYDGDTIRQFVKDMNGKYKKIFAFEPEAKNFEALEQYVERENLHNVNCIKKGTWNKKDILRFDSEEKGFSISEKQGQIECEVDTLDNLVQIVDDLNTATIIKINFLWGVLETLIGGKEMIQENKPKFAIVVGFDEKALIDIPSYLKQLVPEYQFYLRFNRSMPACLTLYAFVK